MKLVCGVSLQQVRDNALWKVKFRSKPREIDTYPNFESRYGIDFIIRSSECMKCIMLPSNKQPEILREFFRFVDKLDEDTSAESSFLSFEEIFDKYGVESH